jgi:hypothetical protein
MAKLSEKAIHILLMVESPNVYVSYDDGIYGTRPVMMASPARGHGTKANPPAAVGGKLIRDGLLDASGTWLVLTAAGREELRAAQAQGWELITGTGHKPRAVQR